MNHTDLVAQYYDETWQDQRLFWSNGHNLAIHMGYWDKDTKSHAESLNNLNKIMAERLNLKRGESLLDAGCGVGGPAIWLANNYGIKVTGITISPLQKEKANSYARRSNTAELVSFELRNFTHTGYQNDSFDVVWAQESVAHAEDKGQFLKEAYRLLKQGGRIIIEDFYIRDNNQNDDVKKLIGVWTENMKIPNLTTDREFEEMAMACGFRNISTEDISKNLAPSFNRYKILIMLNKLSVIPRILGLRKKMQIDNARAIEAQSKAFWKDYWFPGIFYAEK